MPIRSANAIWNGSLKEGKGVISVESGLFKDTSYSFAKRFENEKGTNPEELIAAAHAACFSMALANLLATAGYVPKEVKTTDKAYLEKVGDGFEITKLEIDCKADVPGISEQEFAKWANEAKIGCPVSKALKGVTLVLNAQLASPKAGV